MSNTKEKSIKTKGKEKSQSISTLPPGVKDLSNYIDKRIAKHSTLHTTALLAASGVAHVFKADTVKVIATTGFTVNIDTSDRKQNIEDGERVSGLELGTGFMHENLSDPTWTASVKQDNLITHAYKPSKTGKDKTLSIKLFPVKKVSVEMTAKFVSQLMLVDPEKLKPLLKYLPKFDNNWSEKEKEKWVTENRIEFETQIKHSETTGKKYLSSKVYVDFHLADKAKDSNILSQDRIKTKSISSEKTNDMVKETLKNLEGFQNKKENTNTSLDGQQTSIQNTSPREKAIKALIVIGEEHVEEELKSIMNVIKDTIDVVSTATTIISVLASANLLTAGIKAVIKQLITNTVGDLVNKGGIPTLLKMLSEKIKENLSENMKERIRESNILFSVGIGITTELELDKTTQDQMEKEMFAISDSQDIAILDALEKGFDALGKIDFSKISDSQDKDPSSKENVSEKEFENKVKEALVEVELIQEKLAMGKNNIIENIDFSQVDNTQFGVEEDRIYNMNVDTHTTIPTLVDLSQINDTITVEDVTEEVKISDPESAFENKVKEALVEVELIQEKLAMGKNNIIENIDFSQVDNTQFGVEEDRIFNMNVDTHTTIPTLVDFSQINDTIEDVTEKVIISDPENVFENKVKEALVEVELIQERLAMGKNNIIESIDFSKGDNTKLAVKLDGVSDMYVDIHSTKEQIDIDGR